MVQLVCGCVVVPIDQTIGDPLYQFLEARCGIKFNSVLQFPNVRWSTPPKKKKKKKNLKQSWLSVFWKKDQNARKIKKNAFCNGTCL